MTSASLPEARYAAATHAMPKAALFLALLAALPRVAGAVDLKYETGVSLKHSDNINLSQNNPTSDNVLVPEITFEASQIGSRMQLLARGEVQYLDYLGNTFSDEFRGKFAGKLNWTVLPERMDLVFQDYLSQQPINELDAVTPNNQQTVNLFIAGPSFYARFNPVTRGQFDLRYGSSHAELNDAFNGDRYSATARVLRELNNKAQISANLEAAKVNFNAAGSSADYERYDGYIGYTTKQTNVDLALDLGYSQLKLTDHNDRASSPLVRASVDWRLSARSKLNTTIRYQFTDATQGLITPSIDVTGRNIDYLAYPDIQVEPSVFRERLFRVRYLFTGGRTTLRLQPYYREIHYVDSILNDQKRRGGVVELDYRLHPRLTLSLLAARENRSYEDISREDKDTTVNIGLVDRLTRHWTGRIDLQHRKRDSSAIGRSYDANAIAVGLFYSR